MAGGPIKPFVSVMACPSLHDLYNQADIQCVDDLMEDSVDTGKKRKFALIH